MSAKTTITGFALIAMVGLCLHIVRDFWLPMVLGAFFTMLIARFVR